MADFLFGGPLRSLLYTPPLNRRWLVPGNGAGGMDWIETPSSHVLKLNVPGFSKEDIKINLEDNVLSIKAEKTEKEEKPSKDAVWYSSERADGGFTREVALPEGFQADRIKAHVDNGVLTVIVPKEPLPAKPKPRTIPVNSKL